MGIKDLLKKGTKDGCCDFKIVPKEGTGNEQQEISNSKQSCCGSTSLGKGKPENASFNEPHKEKLELELLYLDLDTCTRCRETDQNMEAAIVEVHQLLQAAGYEVTVKKTHVKTEDEARNLHFVSSPTIRINGQDIQMDVKESFCESCGDICGEDVDCRVWTYQGKEYTAAPKAMIIDAILREVFGTKENDPKKLPPSEELPENLKKFFAAKQNKEALNDESSQINEQNACCCSSDTKGCC